LWSSRCESTSASPSVPAATRIRLRANYFSRAVHQTVLCSSRLLGQQRERQRTAAPHSRKGRSPVARGATDFAPATAYASERVRAGSACGFSSSVAGLLVLAVGMPALVWERGV
jgi:hypothetical protein